MNVRLERNGKLILGTVRAEHNLFGSLSTYPAALGSTLKETEIL